MFIVRVDRCHGGLKVDEVFAALAVLYCTTDFFKSPEWLGVRYPAVG